MGVVDRRQFIIMDHPYEAENFRYISLTCGLTLSYQNELHIIQNGDYILIGYAFSCDGKEIALSPASVDNMHLWAGRWILVTPERLYLDACGHMGVFYYMHGNGIVLSSSLHLISSVCNAEWISTYGLKRGEIPLFDYYPVPCTPYENIYSLLPSQCYSLKDGEVLPRIDYDFSRYTNLSYDEAENLFISGITNVIKKISNSFDSVWVTTTGGVDSRTVLASCYYANIPFKTYTIKRPDTKFWDLKIPKKIAKQLPCEHFQFDNTVENTVSKERLEEQSLHSGGLITAGTEVRQYINDVDVPNKGSNAVLWGTTWEMCAHYYYPNLPECHSENERAKAIKNILGSWLDKSCVHEMSLNKWNRIITENPIKGLDWRERLYWEQRQAGWLNYSYQTIDLFDSVRIAPVNCQYLLELLLSMNKISVFSESEIESKITQKKIIRKCCPKIATIQYGEPTSLLYRVYRKIQRVI